MKPFILQYAEHASDDSEPLPLVYSQDLGLNVLNGTCTPAINLTTSSLETFTKAGHEPTDFSNYKKYAVLDGSTLTRSQEITDPFSIKRISPQLEGETRTFTKHEATDYSNTISRIARRMSLESLTEARESTDVK